MLFNLFKKFLWLSYRLKLTFLFFFKIFLIFKIFSIFLDIYLGFYPKIFNDLGVKIFLQFFFEWLNLNFLNYPIFFYFSVFLFCIYLYIYFPYYIEVRKPYEHIKIARELQEKIKKEDKKLNITLLKEKEIKKSIRKNFKKFFDN